MNQSAFEVILTLLGSTSALIAIILISGYSISLVQLNYRERDLLAHLGPARERHIITGAAFLLFVVLVVVIGLGLLSNTLRINVGDIAGIILLTSPNLISEYRLQHGRALRRHYLVFIVYVTIGVTFLTLSWGFRFANADWSTLIGILGNAAFIAIQLVVFAVGWGVTVPRGLYHVDLTLDNESTISGQWITQSGDDILLQIEGKIVAVRASKVVRRDFHSEDG